MKRSASTLAEDIGHSRSHIPRAPGADWSFAAAGGTLVVVGREAGPARYAILWR